MPITQFDKQNLQMLRRSFAEHIATFEKEHGVKVSLGNIKYQGNEFSTKMEVKLPAAIKAAIEEKQDVTHVINGLRFEHGIEVNEMLVRTTPIIIKSNTYKVVGYNPRRPKFCVIVRNFAGRELLVPMSTIAYHFKSYKTTVTA